MDQECLLDQALKFSCNAQPQGCQGPPERLGTTYPNDNKVFHKKERSKLVAAVLPIL